MKRKMFDQMHKETKQTDASESRTNQENSEQSTATKQTATPVTVNIAASSATTNPISEQASVGEKTSSENKTETSAITGKKSPSIVRAHKSTLDPVSKLIKKSIPPAAKPKSHLTAKESSEQLKNQETSNVIKSSIKKTEQTKSTPARDTVRMKNTQEPIAKQRQKPTSEEVRAHIKESVKEYFKNHPSGHNKESYDGHRLLIPTKEINETLSIEVDDIYEELTEIMKKIQYVSKEEKQVIVAGHGAINLRSYFARQNKKTKETGFSQSKKTSKAIESDSSSNSSSESESESESESDSSSPSYDSKESVSSEELEEKEKSTKSSAKKNPQQKSSEDRIKANEEIVSIKLTPEKIEEIKKISEKLTPQKLGKIKKIAEEVTKNYFQPIGEKKISTNIGVYKHYKISLQVQDLTAEEIAAGIYQLDKVSLENVEFNPKKPNEVFILGSATNTLAIHYLDEKDIPEGIKNRHSRSRKRKQSSSTTSAIATPMEIEKENKDSTSPISTFEKQDEPISSTVNESMQSEITPFLIPPTTNLLDIAPVPQVLSAAAKDIPSSPQESPAAKAFTPYQPGFFPKAEEKAGDKMEENKSSVSTPEKRPLDEKAEPSTPKKQRQAEEFDKKATKITQLDEEIEKQIKRSIAHIIKYKNDINISCLKLEKHLETLKGYEISKGWAELIKSSREQLPKDDFLNEIKTTTKTEKATTLYQIYLILKIIYDSLDKTLTSANKFLDEQIQASEKVTSEMQFSDSDEETKTPAYS